MARQQAETNISNLLGASPSEADVFWMRSPTSVACKLEISADSLLQCQAITPAEISYIFKYSADSQWTVCLEEIIERLYILEEGW